MGFKERDETSSSVFVVSDEEEDRSKDEMERIVVNGDSRNHGVGGTD